MEHQADRQAADQVGEQVGRRVDGGTALDVHLATKHGDALTRTY